MRLFENHVSFEGDEAHGACDSPHNLFENHVSFEGDEAPPATDDFGDSLRTM